MVPSVVTGGNTKPVLERCQTFKPVTTYGLKIEVFKGLTVIFVMGR